jgi:hypothetical protein
MLVLLSMHCLQGKEDVRVVYSWRLLRNYSASLRKWNSYAAEVVISKAIKQMNLAEFA